ncbi:uncharacterized protein LOC141659948 [Apium graveolens]|uniref:uncharacterized protein LOC141659948 n=1 Tax=Apium graveolens TaxID=4045 RepID=UPI003D78B369
MEGKGGCCIARYNDMSKVDRIMLKYRPIAPKPAFPSSGAGSVPESVELNGTNGRPKRRYVKNGSKRAGTGRRKVSPEKSSSGGSWSGGETVVTLPLLSETPEKKEIPVRARNSPIWLSFDRKEMVRQVAGNDRLVMGEMVRLVESCVKVECVMDTWVDRDGWPGTSRVGLTVSASQFLVAVDQAITLFTLLFE